MTVLKFYVVTTANMKVSAPWHVTLLTEYKNIAERRGSSNRRYGIAYKKTVIFTMAKFVFVLMMMVMIIIVVNIVKLVSFTPKS